MIISTVINAGNNMSDIGKVKNRITISTSQIQMSLKIQFRVLS